MLTMDSLQFHSCINIIKEVLRKHLFHPFYFIKFNNKYNSLLIFFIFFHVICVSYISAPFLHKNLRSNCTISIFLSA